MKQHSRAVASDSAQPTLIDPSPRLGAAPVVISIQSQVAHGAVGNGAAVFAMQALGVVVAAAPTTLLSNHPGYPTLRGRTLEPDLLAELLRGLEERGLVEAAFAILTGYLGAAPLGEIVSGFVSRALRANPELVYLCDPVIGDHGPGVFAGEGIAELLRERLAPAASILTPNQFELEILSGLPARSIAAMVAAVAKLRACAAQTLVVTGAGLEDTPHGLIETIVFEGPRVVRIATEKLPMRPNGAGDLFCGLLAARLAAGLPVVEAARRAVDGVGAVLRRTIRENSYELRIAAEDIRAP